MPASYRKHVSACDWDYRASSRRCCNQQLSSLSTWLKHQKESHGIPYNQLTNSSSSKTKVPSLSLSTSVTFSYKPTSLTLAHSTFNIDQNFIVDAVPTVPTASPVSLPPDLPPEKKRRLLKRPAKEKAINNLKAVANSFTPRKEPSALLRQDITTGGTVYISLYSGAGGDSHGALVAGAEPILAVDGCREMLLAHALNFPRCSRHWLALNGDVIVDDDGERTPPVTQDELVTWLQSRLRRAQPH